MPANQMPEQITSAQPEWSVDAQQFVVRLSARYGTAESAEQAGYTLVGSLTLTSSAGTFQLESAPQPVVALDAREPGGDRPLQPVTIRWDRVGGTFTGTVSGRGEVRLVNPAGQIVHRATVTSGDLTVR